MNVTDTEVTHQARLARLVLEENTPEAQKRRDERRQQMVLKKQGENDRLNARSHSFHDRAPETFRPHNPPQYWLSPEDKLRLEFYESQCAEKIKKRQSIVFSEHLVQVDAGGPDASPNIIHELTKWVKIALSKKKYICNICNTRTLPQRCTQECFFYHKKGGCLAGELCHGRHGSPPPVDDTGEEPPLFLNN